MKASRSACKYSIMSSGKSEETVHLRIEITTKGIETKVKKEFPVTTSIDDVIKAIKCTLNPGMHILLIVLSPLFFSDSHFYVCILDSFDQC